MVARKPVTAKPEAATFDVDAWLEELKHQGLKPRNVPVTLWFRSDLLPRIQKLLDDIQRLEDGPEREIGVDEADPIDDLSAEYNRLVDEFQSGGSMTFEFRPMNKRIQDGTYAAWKAKYGDATSEHKDDLILARMAASCVSHPGVTAEAFAAFEDLYGTVVFGFLLQGFVEAYESGGEVTAPFLPKPLPIPDTAG